jgi:hypothetical protein
MSWKKSLLSLHRDWFYLSCASSLSAQVTTGTISGSVTDPNGAVVTGATVKATNLETNAVRDSISDGRWAFCVHADAPRSVSHRRKRAEFPSLSSGIVVNITQTTTVTARLGIAGTTTNVTVTAEAPFYKLKPRKTAALSRDKRSGNYLSPRETFSNCSCSRPVRKPPSPTAQIWDAATLPSA